MNKRQLICGVGINDADYPVQINEDIPNIDGERIQRVVWRCPYYTRWVGVLNRTNSTTYTKKSKSYIGCEMSEEWKTFTKFRKWMETQDWEGNHLDKDILVENNRMYSSETCVFVSPEVNTFMNEQRYTRGELLLGVTRHGLRFRAQIRNAGKREHVGVFDLECDAHQGWVRRKLELAEILLEDCRDYRVRDSIIGQLTRMLK